ncbi:MAG: hypothetical protein IT567_03805 [Alphaproteobacteria bacterium]|nr:hypothetical protein [Alphaproteobacteria bacterium]
MLFTSEEMRDVTDAFAKHLFASVEATTQAMPYESAARVIAAIMEAAPVCMSRFMSINARAKDLPEFQKGCKALKREMTSHRYSDTAVVLLHVFIDGVASTLAGMHKTLSDGVDGASPPRSGWTR